MSSTTRRRSLARAAGAALLITTAGCAQPESPPPVRPNVLLIVIDTLRADRLGAWGYPRPTSPAIDALAAESVVFTEALATSSWTLPSLASVMTSTYPSTHRCTRYRSRLDDSFETLAELLADAGYETGAVATHLFLDERHGLAQGFGHYDTDLVHHDFAESHRAVTSPHATRRAVAWLEATPAERPWFLWVHYFDPHRDYLAHEGITPRFGSRLGDLYDGEIAYTDQGVGVLLGALGRLGNGRETIVVLLSDHGEEFNEHGMMGHGFGLYGEVTRVPLLIRAPGIAPRHVPDPVSLVDVVPTVLDLIDAPPAPGAQGRSLVGAMGGAAMSDRPLLAEVGLFAPFYAAESVVHGRWKLIVRGEEKARELYDRVRDPGETRDLSAARPKVVARLWRTLREQRKQARLARVRYRAAREVELSPENVERLRQLGYVDDGP